MGFSEWIDAGCANLELLEEQFALYSYNPSQVNRSWQQLFQELEKETPTEEMNHEQSVSVQPAIAKEGNELDCKVRLLINAYRTYGHLIAAINPIVSQPDVEITQLKPETYGIAKQELALECNPEGILPEERAPVAALISALKQTYCGRIGVEYMGCDPQIEKWLQKEMEPSHNQPKLSIEQKQMILQQLNKSELLESFLHTKYVGQKRFSLEGAETLIPMLSALIEAGDGVEEIVLGMAHRGRLNVLCNIFNKSYAEVFAEFGENYTPDQWEGSGDVKYHKGFSAEVTTEKGRNIQLELAPNPSHLESVDPVIEGMTRAKQVLRNDARGERVLPLLIHGDAALTGQGVIYETLELYRLPGYSTGGTLHFVINNQIGFTTVPRDSRSTFYCTDIAKTFGMPVFHVNAEDPESCVHAMLLALQIRQKFHIDVFIDLVCYRKYGHNETDEPAFTQPRIYQIIRKKKSVRELYRDMLIHQGVVEKYMAEALEMEFKKALNQALKEIKIQEPSGEKKAAPVKVDPFRVVETGVDKETLQKLAKRCCEAPKGFNLHPKIAQLLKDRFEMAKEKPLDWGMAETLAYASLLQEGRSIRIAGQDTCRGTFSHRHALWVDQVNETAYFPLQHVNGGRFEIYNSSLSENAALGFEFGYSASAPETLVIWEAQFGDFANGGQVIIDQFIVPSEQKWGQISSVVLFLPHGFEGQGPEHSSARMERYLMMAGNDNLRIVNPTTPAQLFHLLRRHMLLPERKPLVVFTPKGLLRHPACVSRLEDLTEGHFAEVLDDPAHPKKVNRLVFCTGRLYYDLADERSKRQAGEVALVRLEQLYPLHVEKLKELISHYEGFQECFWTQEEPANMGAWESVRGQIQELLPKNCPLTYIGRPRSAATAVGAHALHKRQQAAILEAVFKSYPVRLMSHEQGIKS
ncbi:MAG: 2-oxoglutarate dehydrogenase E1 component [Parachlamydia sp.]|nr:2-oxoglutarate dehydrogenase E1 component [Parachlamydia sp.]